MRDSLAPCYSGEGDDIEWIQGCNGYRLPTEAEWEHACRAGSQTAYSFGDDDSIFGDDDSILGSYAWYKEAGSTAHPVGGKEPNDWGLYDMHGNVWEWVWDWYGPYAVRPSGQAETDPLGAAKSKSRALRGGSVGDWSKYLRCGLRFRSEPGDRDRDWGFRAARSLPRQP